MATTGDMEDTSSHTTNMKCAVCGRPFYRKPSYIAKRKSEFGLTCSMECSRVTRRKMMSGEKNHQYGLKGSLNASFKSAENKKKNNRVVDVLVYDPSHPYADSCGRVTKHRKMVEDNNSLFNPDVFEAKNGRTVLKKGYLVHHIDGNHNNNTLENLQILTRAEHTRIHNMDYITFRSAETGRILKGRRKLPTNDEIQCMDEQLKEYYSKLIARRDRQNKPITLRVCTDVEFVVVDELSETGGANGGGFGSTGTN